MSVQLPAVRALTMVALERLDAGLVFTFHETTCNPSDPTPIYDALVAERATGRDSRGRFLPRRAS